jgi:hypothetical protein
MANRRFIDFPIAASVGDNDIVLIWQDGLNKQTTKATLLQGSPSSLAGLTDVDIAGLINGQILQYNSTTSKWENVDRTDINLSELGDVTIVAPANGQVLVYNSSTSKWENSSGGYVPYTGAVTTVNLGAQTIQAGSFVKAGGTSAQFLKADGSVDSSTYGTGTVTSVALTMPTAFSVANSPVTTTGTLAVTATGTTSQYIRGDGSLETFPALTGFVPYTGATADVNLGTFDLLAERGTFENNGSSNTLTVNHTSGSGYGIIVTKGGNNEALYVSKTSGSGNAMTVVGGRTSLVDLALSSVTNTAGDFLTLSGGVVHKRTAAQTLTDIGGQAALTNPVTGTGGNGQVAYFTGTSAISSGSNFLFNSSESNLTIERSLTTLGNALTISKLSDSDQAWLAFRQGGGSTGTWRLGYTGGVYDFRINAGSDGSIGTQALRIFQSSQNVVIGTATSDNGAKFQVGGTATISGDLGVGRIPSSGYKVDIQGNGGLRILDNDVLRSIILTPPTSAGAAANVESSSANGLNLNSSNASGNINFLTAGSTKVRIITNGNVGINTDSPFAKLSVNDGTNINLGIKVGQTDSSAVMLNAYNDAVTANIPLEFRASKFAFQNGNVGIGEISPTHKLQILGGSDSGLRITNSSGDSRILLNPSGGQHGEFLLYNNSNNLTTYLGGSGTASNYVMAQGGNFLIGTTTDSGEKLRVQGQIGVYGATVASGYSRALYVRGSQNVADGGTLTLSVTNSALIFIAENNTGTGALFFCGYASATITKISDPSNMFDVADTAGKLCIFKSAVTDVATVKNRLGSTKNITVSYIGVSD